MADLYLRKRGQGVKLSTGQSCRMTEYSEGGLDCSELTEILTLGEQLACGYFARFRMKHIMISSDETELCRPRFSRR